MAQNSTKNGQGTVDLNIHQVMRDIHNNCVQAAERYGDPGNYLFGANIDGFIKRANAILDQDIT